ncbi:MAG: LysR family transcriptional regulator [Sphingobium sp.]
MMERYLLRYFLSVIDQGNFSKAATHCHVSQPTLSAGIAKLERDLRKPLFHRTNRRVELTEAGARLAPLARRIEAEFAQAEREVTDSGQTDTIRIGILITTPTRWTETLLVENASSIGHERVEIVEGRERDILERLTRGRIDVALTIIREGDDRFRAMPLLTEPYGMAFPRHHRLADRQTVTPEELLGETMIVRRQCEMLAETSRFFTAHGVRPFFSARPSEEGRALAYVRAGAGITLMPRSLAIEDLGFCELEGFAKERRLGFSFADHTNPAQLLQRQPLQLWERFLSEQTKLGIAR